MPETERHLKEIQVRHTPENPHGDWELHVDEQNDEEGIPKTWNVDFHDTDCPPLLLLGNAINACMIDPEGDRVQFVWVDDEDKVTDTSPVIEYRVLERDPDDDLDEFIKG